MALHGTLLVRPSSKQAIVRRDTLAVFEDERSWAAERVVRRGAASFTISVPKKKKFRAEDFQGMKILKKEGTHKSVVLTLRKAPGQPFLDDIWLLLDSFQCEVISASHTHSSPRVTPTLVSGGRHQRLDVVALLGNRMFFVVARGNLEPEACIQELHSLAAWKKEAQACASELAPLSRATLVLWYASPEMPPEDLQQAAARHGILLLCRAHLSYYAKMKGEPVIGRHSFIRDLFRGEPWAGAPRMYPAIRISVRGLPEHYICVGKPQELLQLCRVDRRSPVLEQSYQRLFRADKIRNARQYLQQARQGFRGVFGNSILLVAEGPIQFEPIDSDEPNIGWIRIPSVYAMVSIVDGQHRLYSYMETDRQGNRELPFILFSEADDKFARTMFVSINSNQQKVQTELLWDNWADLEPGESVNVRSAEYRKYVIARVARNMVRSRAGPLGQLVQIPGFPEGAKAKPHLLLNTLCRGLNRLSCLRQPPGSNRFSLRKKDLSVDEEALAIQKALEPLLRDMFARLESENRAEWNLMDKGRIFSNGAFAVHLCFLDQMLCRWQPPEMEDISELRLRFSPHFRKYANFWREELKLDDAHRADGTGKALEVSQMGDRARGAFAARGLEYVAKRLAAEEESANVVKKSRQTRRKVLA